MPASESHIRGISATLTLLDKALCEFEMWAQGHEVRSVLYGIRNTLSKAQREVVAQEVAEMKEVLQDIRTTLDLEVSVRSVDKMIASSCSIVWASLVELESRHLRRYGEVPHTLATYLEPRIAALNERLRNISDTVARDHSH